MSRRLMVGMAMATAVLALPSAPVAVASCQVVASTTGVSNRSIDGRSTEVGATITVDTVCSDPGAPAPSPGGGEGGAAPCTTRPLGPLEEVQAVWAAVNAEQAPDPTDPNYVEDVTNPGGVGRVVETSWYRVEGTSIQVRYAVTCPGANATARWVTVVPDSAGTLVPQVRAIDLVGSLHAEVVRRLPTPELRVGPADEDPDGWTYVQNRTFFWVDQGAGQWEAVSGSTSAAGITVTVQATPVRLVVNPGDGSEAVVCDGAPTAVTKAAYYPDIEGCSFIYRHSSATAPNGETFPVVASIVWHATWSASTGEGGDLGYLSTTSDVRDLAVAEIQALIVATDP